MQPRRGLPPNVMPMLSEDPRYPTNPSGMRQPIMQSAAPPSVAEILSQGSPGQPMPDLGGATSAASRQRQIADMLMQGAQQQDNRSIAGGLSQLGQAFLARRAGQKADTAEDKQREVASLLMQQAMQGGDQGRASLEQLLMQNPDAAVQYAMQTRQAAETNQREQARLAALQSIPGLTDQQRALIGQGVGVENAAEMAFAPPPEPATYASAFDSQGVRKYTEGPDIGQPVPGFETPRTERGMSVSLDENGNPVIVFGGPGVGSAFGKAGDSTGAKAFGTALEDAGTADATLALANQARTIIEGGYNSGALAPIKGEVGRIAAEFGFGDKEKVADYEQFTAINNQLAAQMLKLFGGSDTERELAISIASNIGPRFSEETNKRMLDALDQAIAIQRQKPEYIAQWTRRNGSLDAIDLQTGLGFQATWDRLLQSNVGNLSGAGNDQRQVAVEGAAQGVLPAEKMSRLEELRAKRDAGRLQ